ncbi:DNA replication protein DnaD [Selenomonas sp. oral taxon 920]|uniref:Sec-independent protein translocase subunit TatA/TatB n=1 Tax=Selenomonas sp. oral taxon 920 TaxID=1884263 RepID=UPI000840DAC6|nr:twin-arginine translocase TatA/TatE family subunit [Selenomonas sp. oral taxon 920]AOH48679.1 DNA replication protein DnaD [Selenomonas sp. oral taxon 920]
MFGIGVPELILILVVGLIVFGPGKLPEMGRSLGKGIREFRKASNALTAAINAPEPPPAAPPQPASAPQPAQTASTAEQTAPAAPAASPTAETAAAAVEAYKAEQTTAAENKAQ